MNNVADDTYAIQTFDGAGRVVGAASNHPGSTGGYKAQLNVYNLMGQVIKQSNPTEINAGWGPVGDDTSGWLYSQQTYDWKGRPTVIANADSVTTKEAIYTGCGCAGGEVVVTRDEVGRRQKMTYDILGRPWKTQTLYQQPKTEPLNGNGAVYATAVNTYNARDQITQVRQYQGLESGSTFQDTTMTYDGHGRLWKRRVPQQQVDSSNSASTDHTTYNYNSDDTLSYVTDARGVVANFSYNNNRRLVSQISYDRSNVPTSANVAAAPAVTFAYDAAGNRTSMTDGLGSTAYSYNQLSQMQSEKRTFTNVGSFTLSYDYNLAGELKKITDATSVTIDYGYDAAGRLIGMTGSGTLYAGVSNYATNFQYRAWGGLKAMTDGKGNVTSMLYNANLRPSHFQISGNMVSQNYDYNNDGRISVVHNITDQNFDRSYSYDQVGRLMEAKSGADVNGYQYAPIPYHETFGYDAFSNLTARQSQSWNGLTDDSDAATYTNNRRGGWGYDADGHNTTIDTRTNTFDAVGQQIAMNATAIAFNGSSYTVNQANGYDGERAMSKEVLTQSNAPGYVNTTYYLRSSVLRGAIIEEINSSGQKNVGYVYSPGGKLLATQQPNNPNMVTWKHSSPAGTGEYTVNTYNGVTGRTEFDPLGANLSVTAPEDPPPGEGDGDVGASHIGLLMSGRWSDFFNLSSGCTIDFRPAATCSEAISWANSGGGQQCPNNQCAMYTVVNGQLTPQVFHVEADGYSGYETVGSIYLGGGHVYVPLRVQSSGERPPGTYGYSVAPFQIDEILESEPQGPQTPSGGRATDPATKDPCPPEKRRFFDWLVGPLTTLSKDLNTTLALTLTHAAKEGGWITKNLDHNQPLNNPFGVNKIAGRQAVGNISYPSLDDAIAYYKGRYGPSLQGAQTPDKYVYGLEHLPDGTKFNKDEEGYSKEFGKVYTSMLKFMKLCGIKQ